MCMVAVIAAAVTSCNSDDGNNDFSMFMSFVTLENSTDTGTKFTTNIGENSELVTFTSSVVLKEEQYPKGKRYIIGYSNEKNERYASGPINLYTIITVANGDVARSTPEAIALLQKDPISVTLLQREGNYINIEANAPVTISPKLFGLYVDENTMNNEYPDVYVGFQTDNTGGVDRQFYGSFSIKSLWESPTCKGIKVHFRSFGVEKEIELKKSESINTKPVE